MADEKKKIVQQGEVQTSTPKAPTYGTAATKYEQPFSYDVNGDALYQQYKDRYTQNAKMSMKDTMGQAANLTGGYGSTYSQAAGQQAYDRQMTGLTDMIPTLEQNAYTRWKDAGDRARQDEQTALENQRYNYSNLSKLIASSGYQPNADELSAAGMDKNQANALRQMWMASNPAVAYYQGAMTADQYFKLTGQYPAGYTPPSAGGGGDGGGGGHYSSATLKFQKDYNQVAQRMGWNTIAEDGIAGKQTDAASDKLDNYNKTMAKHYS